MQDSSALEWDLSPDHINFHRYNRIPGHLISKTGTENKTRTPPSYFPTNLNTQKDSKRVRDSDITLGSSGQLQASNCKRDHKEKRSESERMWET